MRSGEAANKVGKRPIKDALSQRKEDVPKLLIAPRRAFTIERCIEKPRILSTGGDLEYGVVTFKLSEMQDWEKFTNLFAQYKVLSMVVNFSPIGNLPSDTHGHIYSIVHYGNIPIPSNLSDMKKYLSFKEKSFPDEFERVIDPNCPSQSSPRQWTRCTDPHAEWYGVVYAANIISSAKEVYNVSLKVGISYYLPET
jgi:hypothetical protein